MTTGYPKPPTIRSIIAGIAVFILACLMILSLGDIVKYVGAAFIYPPAKLGILRVASPEEIIPVDMSSSPTTIQIKNPGWYLLYTDNYDLLVINDAVIASDGEPWLKFETENRETPWIVLVERGLSFYDTPLVKGRPAARIKFLEPGSYSMNHPRRPIFAHLVPDYTTGHEGWFIFIVLLELSLLVYVGWTLWKRLTVNKKSKSQEKLIIKEY